MATQDLKEEFLNHTVQQTPGIDLDTEPRQRRVRILVVDDDLDYVNMIKTVLKIKGFDVAGAQNHEDALLKCSHLSPDLILLDLMMPDVDGLSTYQRLRQITKAPIIFISAVADPDYAVRSLEIGADDYITKPFHVQEVIARINRTLRQSDCNEPPVEKVFPEIGLRIDYETHEAILRGKKIMLHPREFAFLTLLAERAPRNISYKILSQTLWGEDNQKNRAHLKAIAFALRKKLEQDPSFPRLIVNNRSLGYQLLTRAGDL